MGRNFYFPQKASLITGWTYQSKMIASFDSSAKLKFDLQYTFYVQDNSFKQECTKYFRVSAHIKAYFQ